MYRILIVDDEPLVQVGLRSMLTKSDPDRVQVVGAAANGKEALDLIRSEKPDIVITDIKMPVMNGIELMKQAHLISGSLPVFIMLTAYEEFDLARQAMAQEAVDYLVKIELSEETLGAALSRAMERVDRYRKQHPSQKEGEQKNLEEYRQKFFLKLLHREYEADALQQEGKDLSINLNYDRYIAAYCVIQTEKAGASTAGMGETSDNPHMVTLCASCYSMVKEIVSRYLSGEFIVDDLHHFTFLYGLGEQQPVAELMNTMEEAILNAQTMIQNYFNVSVFFGIGTAVNELSLVPDTYEEAMTAAGRTSPAEPVLRFSHVVGANRRSGKDKLIASIQDYIDENLNGKLQLNEVAEKFGLSAAYLSVIFKKNTEVGFSEYVNTKKIERAKQMLLQGDMKIYEVADALGFESAYYFSKVFKKVDGHSPREYIQSKTEEE